MTYQNILRLIGNKDPKGLEELYQAYGSRFYAYAVQRWHLTEDEAWDVVYKTLEMLVLKLSNYQFQSQALFEGFLFKVLVNFLRQHFRSKRSNHHAEIDFVDLNNERELPYQISKQISKSAFYDYYKTETVENPVLVILNEALSKLEPHEKDILLLRAQNYSYDEIAGLLGIDNNQLKVKHYRAKQKLLNLINEIQNK
jgi:RNA polymerase sigma-70 factor (ECF subfamily)